MTPPEEMELWDRIRFMEDKIKRLEDRVTQLERSDYADAEIDTEYNKVTLIGEEGDYVDKITKLNLESIIRGPQQWQGYATWDTDQPNIHHGPGENDDQ